MVVPTSAQPRSSPHVRDRRAARRTRHVRALALHGDQPHQHRPHLRPPCPRQPPARRRTARRLQQRLPRCGRRWTFRGRRANRHAGHRHNRSGLIAAISRRALCRTRTDDPFPYHGSPAHRPDARRSAEVAAQARFPAGCIRPQESAASRTFWYRLGISAVEGSASSTSRKSNSGLEIRAGARAGHRGAGGLRPRLAARQLPRIRRLAARTASGRGGRRGRRRCAPAASRRRRA